MATTRSALTEADIRLLVVGRSPHERALIASRLCDQMQANAISDEDRGRAQEILRIMAGDATEMVRRALATTLRSSPLVPRDVAVRLARDTERVAIPILGASPAFTDEDLMEIVRLGDPIRQLAVARRPFVSEQVSQVIVEVGERPAVAAVCSNDNAVVPDALLQKVMDRFQHAEEVLQAVALRRELPLSVTERLIDMVGEHLREHLINHHGVSDETALRIAAGATERASIDLVDQAGRTADVKKFVVHLHKIGRLNASLLLRALAHGHVGFLEHGLAELAGVPHHRTWLMVHDAGDLGLRAIYERAGLPARLFPAFRVAIDTYHTLEQEGSPSDAASFQEQMLSRFLTQSHPTPAEDLDYLMDKLDLVRRAAAATVAEAAVAIAG
ncbi:MAG: hypothetical protein JWO33_2233 [Caulobacteraceae bacterium]|nr:hypothetical protein [Caulobacteraceae bacterium]